VISPKSGHERRRDPRLENNIPVKICRDDGDLVTETQNISRSGAYCRVNQYIAPMTKLKIHLLVSVSKSGKNVTKKISCEGVVVRAEPVPGDEGCRIAIFFSDMARRDGEYITDYVRTCLTKDKTI
jgi:hypothetical protein